MSKAMTLRMPDELHEMLRMKAFIERRSITSLVLEAIAGIWGKPIEDTMLATRDDIRFARECQECGQGALMFALANALAEEWPEHTPLIHVIGKASLGIADTAYTLHDLIADLAPACN